jgi:hypothetical protein
MIAKADSIHSLQGLTVGERKAIKRLIIYGWDKEAESKWPGILYVGASRAEDERNLALSFNISEQAMNSIGKSPAWVKTNAEVNRLVELATSQRHNYIAEHKVRTRRLLASTSCSGG